MPKRANDTRVRSVQFHPNLSYEDFVRGWRPTGEEKLSLADGVFMESINAALEDPESVFVVVTEEINRGNPAQIGELLTLLESDKRTPDEALRLCYPDPDGIRRPVYIPANLYVIGIMNIADRSLALLYLALRRRQVRHGGPGRQRGGDSLAVVARVPCLMLLPTVPPIASDRD